MESEADWERGSSKYHMVEMSHTVCGTKHEMTEIFTKGNTHSLVSSCSRKPCLSYTGEKDKKRERRARYHTAREAHGGSGAGTLYSRIITSGNFNYQLI